MLNNTENFYQVLFIFFHLNSELKYFVNTMKYYKKTDRNFIILLKKGSRMKL